MGACTTTENVSAFYGTNLQNVVTSYDRLADRISYTLGYPLVNIEVHRNQLYEFITISVEMFTKFAGYDQDWSYHAVKSAQEGLVRYFAIRSNGRFNINMISPPTYMKNDTEQYWKKTLKYEIWQNLPPLNLPDASMIAEICSMFLIDSNKYVNGQNLVCDGGASYLYIDQHKNNEQII